MAIFCTYKDRIYCKTLIACSSLLKKDNLGANQHFEVIVESLSVYGLVWYDVICIVGDNWKVNKKHAEISCRALFGFSSHKFNLPIELCICKQIRLLGTIKVIRKLMSRLRTMKKAARLWKITNIGAFFPTELVGQGSMTWSSDILILKNIIRAFWNSKNIFPHRWCAESC